MDCGIFTSKTVLLLLSLIFWAAGAALAYVGSYVIKSYNRFDNFLEDKYTLVPACIIISAGVIMFIVGLVGLCATVRESSVGLGFFFIIIMVIFAAEVSALVLGFIYQGKIRGDLERTMNNVFMKYDGQNPESRAVDYLQDQAPYMIMMLQCCGINSYTNWTGMPWAVSHNGSVPVSCCKNQTDVQCTGRLDQPDRLNTEGCEEKLIQLLQYVFSYAMLVLLGFAIIQLFGMLSVCVITCGRRRAGYQSLHA